MPNQTCSPPTIFSEVFSTARNTSLFVSLNVHVTSQPHWCDSSLTGSSLSLPMKNYKSRSSKRDLVEHQTLPVVKTMKGAGCFGNQRVRLALHYNNNEDLLTFLKLMTWSNTCSLLITASGRCSDLRSICGPSLTTMYGLRMGNEGRRGRGQEYQLRSWSCPV